MKKVACAWVVLMIIVGVAFGAGVPPLINYQGEIKDDSGTPLATGFHNIDFRIYTAESAGTLLWSKRYNLYVMNGMFNVIIGQGGSAVAGDNPAFTDIVKVFEAYAGDSGYPRYLSLASDGGAEFSPRQQLLSAPYAMRAATADFADAALNASNALHATRAANADHADNADLATAATTATQAGNADKLGNQVPSYYARQNQMAAAPAGNWQSQFWDGGAFHNGPLYWADPVLGVGGQPGNDAGTGLRMVKGSLRPLFGEGWDKGIVFQNGPSDANALWMYQTESGNGKEFYLRTQGSQKAFITAHANAGVTVQGDETVTIRGGNQITMDSPKIVSSALKEGCRISWPTFSGTKGQWAEFTAEGDGMLMLNARQMLWEINVPEHMDGDFINGDRRTVEVRFAKNISDDTTYHSFAYPLKKGTVIKSRLKEVWGDNCWTVWVIYFN
ncbi:MAG: hypothetical protein PHP44_09970 [Kiritimatiellae bacterium]|nr:hypothetical protein [Kiritimatiellia bacterium]MDD4736414.1 hypothetical protein [Kiritimatiellia bacterium]